MIFNKLINANFANNFIRFPRSKKIPTSFFDNYRFKKPKLALYFFYNYQKMITVVESTFNIEKDIVFNHNHSNSRNKV